MIKQNKKNIRKLLVILFILILLFFYVRPKKKIYSRTSLIMDTVVEVSCAGYNEKKALRVIDLVFNRIKEIEALLNKYNKNSLVYKINESAYKTPVEIPEDVLDIISDSIHYSMLTEGAFDITIGPLMDIWGFNDKKGRMPSPRELRKALSLVDYRNILLDSKNSTIRFKKRGMSIDLGGVAKGYAVDEAVKVIEANGLKSAVVNIGGDIFCLGAHPVKRYWEIGIQHPKEMNKIIGILQLKDLAVATSGGYERYRIINGKRYSHVINPESGLPAKGVLGVTIVSSSVKKADILATAIYVLGKDKGLKLINEIADTEALIVSEDKNNPSGLDIVTTDGLNRYLTLKEDYYLRKW